MFFLFGGDFFFVFFVTNKFVSGVVRTAVYRSCAHNLTQAMTLLVCRCGAKEMVPPKSCRQHHGERRSGVGEARSVRR